MFCVSGYPAFEVMNVVVEWISVTEIIEVKGVVQVKAVSIAMKSNSMPVKNVS